MPETKKELEILLVEDSPGDVRLTMEALRESEFEYRINVVEDGEEAINYLRRQEKHVNAARPDIILLDLNLPKKTGHEVLAEVKQDEKLKTIPIVVLTISRSEEDILNAYEHRANCYIVKPIDKDQVVNVIKSLGAFWQNVAELPPRG